MDDIGGLSEDNLEIESRDHPIEGSFEHQLRNPSLFLRPDNLSDFGVMAPAAGGPNANAAVQAMTAAQQN